jgi:hypothetical protein
MELLKCLELYARIRSYFTIFILHVHIFIKLIADSWSPSKTERIDMSFVYFWRQTFFSKILWGTRYKNFQKIFSRWTIYIYKSVDIVFDEDYEIDIIFVEKCNKKCKNSKIRARLHIKIFRQKNTNDMSVDSAFDVDHESAIIFMKISTWRVKIVTYEWILAYSSRHFNNSIVNNYNILENGQH